jgi:DNA-binding GntR family transcriptional regulator
MHNLTDEDVHLLGEIQGAIEANLDVPGFLQLDRQFHLLTYSRCRIEQLTTTVFRLWNATQHYRRAYMELTGPRRRWVVNAEHRLLLDAINRRDEVDAARFLAGHIRRTRVELSHHPEVFGENG